MSIPKDLKKISSKVEHLLIMFPSLRDDDKKLFIVYLNVFHSLKDSLNSVAYEKLKKIFMEAPHFESIRRSRQKIQETTPSLQGKSREKRVELEKEVRKIIKGEK